MLLIDEISENLEKKIRTMEVGEKLDSERNMAKEYNVSRNMLRESLRKLSDKGLIDIVPGKGAYVSNKQDELFASNLENILFDNQSNLTDIVEVRQVIEMEVCLKAVNTATEEDISALEEIYRKMEKNRTQIALFNEYDMEFHITMAKASHNSIYPFLLNALYSISEKRFFKITELYPTRVDSAQKEHKGLIDAIKNHDRKQMKQVAKRHFNIQDILISQSLQKNK